MAIPEHHDIASDDGEIDALVPRRTVLIGPALPPAPVVLRELPAESEELPVVPDMTPVPMHHSREHMLLDHAAAFGGLSPSSMARSDAGLGEKDKLAHAPVPVLVLAPLMPEPRLAALTPLHVASLPLPVPLAPSPGAVLGRVHPPVADKSDGGFSVAPMADFMTMNLDESSFSSFAVIDIHSDSGSDLDKALESGVGRDGAGAASGGTAHTATHVAFKASSVVVDTRLDAAEGMKRLLCTVVPDDTAMHEFFHATQFEFSQRVPPKSMHKDEVELQRAMKRELESIQEFGCLGDTPCALSDMSYNAIVMSHM
jgi:hypothetical protein